MFNEQKELNSSQAISDESFPIDINMVEFQREWVLWENYQAKEGKIEDWKEQIKQVASFKDLLTFWQFWNNYECSIPKNFIFDGERFVYFFEEKRRIDGLNLFIKGITPTWEDEHNKGGRIVNVLWDIKEGYEEFLSAIENVWLDLVLMLLGESLPASKFINGIRLIDKSKFRQKSFYRIEIWLNAGIMMEETKDEFSKLKNFLGDKCHSTVEDKPIG